MVAKSSRGWTALDEALAAKDRELAHMLQRAAIAQVNAMHGIVRGCSLMGHAAARLVLPALSAV